MKKLKLPHTGQDTNPMPSAWIPENKEVIMNIAPLSVQPSDLPDIAQRINQAVDFAQQSAHSAVEHAIKAGRLLIEAKTQVEHGAWEDWLRSNCTVAPRTAQAYMRLAKQYPSLDDAKAQRVADLPLREAVNAISRKAEYPLRIDRNYSNTEEWRRHKAEVGAIVADIRLDCKRLNKYLGAGRPPRRRDLKTLKARLLAAVQKLDEQLAGEREGVVIEMEREA